MTIFLDITKKFLVEAVNEARQRAKSANTSYLGSKTRDIEHSKNKLALLKELSQKLEQFQDCETDELTWIALKRLIAEYQKKNKALCDHPKQSTQTSNLAVSKRSSYSKQEPDQEVEGAPHPEGEFRTAMIKVNSLLDGIFLHVIEENKLVNIQPDFHPDEQIDFDKKVSPSRKYMDAFDKLLYYCAYWLVQKYKDPEEQSLMQSCLSSFSFTSVVKVGTEKADLLKDTMIILKEALEGSEKDRLQQRSSRQATVLLALNTILGGNTTLCRSYSFQPELPISAISVGSILLKLPAWEPAIGRLKNAMENAYLEVRTMPPLKELPKQSVEEKKQEEGIEQGSSAPQLKELPKQSVEEKKQEEGIEQGSSAPQQPIPHVPLDNDVVGEVQKKSLIEGSSVVQRGTMFGAQTTIVASKLDEIQKNTSVELNM